MTPCIAIAALALATLAAAGSATAQSPRTAGAPRMHVIAMVERGQYGIAFEPLRTTAAPGDTLRFEQQGALPHNVRFKSTPPGATFDAPLESPMLTTRGATFDVILDRRFAPGKYHFVCVPHETLGMAGLLYVEALPTER